MSDKMYVEYGVKISEYDVEREEILGGHEAVVAWEEALDALHRFAIARGALPGQHVFMWALEKARQLKVAWTENLAKDFPNAHR